MSRRIDAVCSTRGLPRTLRAAASYDPIGRYAARASITLVLALFFSWTPQWAHGLPASAKKAKGTGSAEHVEKPPAAEETAMMEDTIIRLTNIVRKRKGLHAVKSSRALAFLARHHSTDMCRTGAFKHESDAFPQGWKRFMERMRHAGLRDGGENIAFRTWIPDRKKWSLIVVKGWVHSPPHLKNILDPAFRYVGVGIGQCNGQIGYVTQVFSSGKGMMPDVRQDRLLP